MKEGSFCWNDAIAGMRIEDYEKPSPSNVLLSTGVISQAQTVAAVVMEPTMILAYDPWGNLHQLWKDHFSDKTEWIKIERISTTERKLGISR